MRTGEKQAPAQEATPRRAGPSTIDYVHLPLGEDVLAFAGYYTPEQEVRLPFRDREVLYVTGYVAVEATCSDAGCATGSFWYAIVPGYVVSWQSRRTDAGLPVTEVEPIGDPETRQEIERTVMEREAVTRVEFR